MEISGINDAIFHSFIIFVILVLVHVASTNQKRDHLLEVFGAIRAMSIESLLRYPCGDSLMLLAKISSFSSDFGSRPVQSSLE